jgi:hypothetical protein
MSRSAAGGVVAGAIMTIAGGVAAFAGKQGCDWWTIVMVLSSGFILAMLALEYAMISTRSTCMVCRADVERDFMATPSPGIPERCKACAGEASSYPLLARRPRSPPRRAANPDAPSLARETPRRILLCSL